MCVNPYKDPKVHIQLAIGIGKLANHVIMKIAIILNLNCEVQIILVCFVGCFKKKKKKKNNGAVNEITNFSGIDVMDSETRFLHVASHF